MDLFDFESGLRAKTEGMSAAALTRSELLSQAREIAVAIARHRVNRRVTADDVGRALRLRGLPDLGPAAGSIFRGSMWEFTGERVRSARISNHARELKVWEFVGG